MSARPTPLTDAFLKQHWHDNGPSNREQWTCSEANAWRIAEHARRLERDRGELVEALDAAESILSSYGLMDHAQAIRARALLARLKGDK